MSATTHQDAYLFIESLKGTMTRKVSTVRELLSTARGDRMTPHDRAIAVLALKILEQEQRIWGARSTT